MIAPVETQILPAVPEEMYFRKVRTSGVSLNAAARSPPPTIGWPYFGLIVGQKKELIVFPGFRAVLTWSSAMPPTNPPSMYIWADGLFPKTRPIPSTNAVPRAPCTPPARYLLFRICVICRIAFFTEGSVNFVLPLNSDRYFAGPAVRA